MKKEFIGMKLFLSLLIFLSSLTIDAQQIKFYGKFEPGQVIIGTAEGAESIMLNDRLLQFDKSGTFIFGFDRDDAGTYYLKIKFKEGRAFVKKIDLPKREYKIQKINRMKKELVTAPKSQNERIRRERKIIRNARAGIGQIDTALYSSGIIRPVKRGRISSVFGSQRVLNGIPKSPHNGYDIAAPKGTPVYAMADGVVRLAADTFYYSGNFILLDHGQGLNSVYLHLSKKYVKNGDHVKKGEKIGEIGTTGRSTGPHLHWGVQWYEKRVDPYGLLKMHFKKNDKGHA